MNSPKQKIVILLHGVNTNAKWEKNVAPTLAAHGIIPFSLDHGFVHALPIYDPITRNRKLLQFRSAYGEIVKHTGVTRPSIIAHSFGSWLLGKLLNDYAAVNFDKVILTGSLLPCDYDWSSKLVGKKPQICSLVNERQTADFLIKVDAAAGKLGYGYGRGGVDGFENVLDDDGKPPPNFRQLKLNIRHSDAFDESRFDQWAKWINQSTIPLEDRAEIDKALLFGLDAFAKCTGLPENKLRLRLLVPDVDAQNLVPAETSLSEYRIPDGEKIELIELSLTRDYAAAYSYVYNRTSVKRMAPSVRAGGALVSFVATAPIRHPVNGKLIAVVGLDTTDLSLKLPPDSVIKIAITTLATEIAHVYCKKSNGV